MDYIYGKSSNGNLAVSITNDSIWRSVEVEGDIYNIVNEMFLTKDEWKRIDKLLIEIEDD